MIVALKEIFTALGLGIGVVSYIPYLRDIFRGRTRPHVFSWFVWGLLTAIAFAGQIADHGGAGSAVTALTAVTCFIIAIIALFRGEKQISRSDWVSFAAALLTVPLWLATQTPLYAIILVTLIDALSFYPTFRKCWRRPHEETLSTFAFSSLKFVLSLLALENYTTVTVLYPLFLVLANSGFVLYVLWRRSKMKEKFPSTVA